MDAALNHFLERTQRLTLSPAEYGQACEWLWDRVPPSVLLQVVTRVLDSRKLEQLPGKRLAWIRWQVDEDIQAWRRAVGPTY